jgi:hypothetical protein
MVKEVEGGNASVEERWGGWWKGETKVFV